MNKEGPGKRIRQLLEEGKKYREIQDELDVAGSTIAYHANRIGMRKFSYTRKEYDWKKIQELYDFGYNFTEISDQLGINVTTLRDGAARGKFVTLSGYDPRRKVLRKIVNAENIKNGKSNALFDLVWASE